MNKLGEFLRAERLRRGLGLGELARLVGYRNINKGARRIACLEQAGTGKGDILTNIVEALGLDWMVVERLAEEDRQERLLAWERWADEPVPMCLVIRLMAAVYVRKALTAEVTTPEQAEAWACDYARHHRLRVCLVVSRRLSVWIDADGQVESRTEAAPGQANIPFMLVKHRKFMFTSE